MLASRSTHELDQRAIAFGHRRTVREGPLHAGDRLLVAGALGEDPVVDEVAQGAQCRVLVRDARQQQLLEARRRGDGLRARIGEFGRESLEQAVRRWAQPCTDLVECRVHGAGATGRLVAFDEQVADLVDQAQRDDLAGLDRGRPRRALRVHPRRQAADRGEVGDDDITARADEGGVDLVPLERRPANVEVAPIRVGMAHPARMARGHRGRQPAASVRRSTPRPAARPPHARWPGAGIRGPTDRTRSSTAERARGARVAGRGPPRVPRAT